MADIKFPTDTPDITPVGTDRVLLSRTTNGDAASDATLDSLPVSSATSAALADKADTSYVNSQDSALANDISTNLTSINGLTTNKVDKTTTVNGHPLSADVTVTASDVGSPSGSGTSTGANTGDETTATIKSKLGITTLSGSNTGDSATNTTSNTYADGKVSDTAYNATTWDGVTGIAPSKNAVRDKVESIETEIAGKQPLATVLTNTTASYTTTIDTRLANTSGTNTGDQVGDGITITGAGTIADPFVSVGGGGGVGTLQQVTDLGATTTNTIEINATDKTGLKIVDDGGFSEVQAGMLGGAGFFYIQDSLGNATINLTEGNIDATTFNSGTLSGDNTGDNATNSQYSPLLTSILGKQFFHGIEGSILGAFPTHATTTTIPFTFSTTPVTYWNNGVKTIVSVDTNVTLAGTAGLYFIYFDVNGSLVSSTSFPGLNGTNVLLASCLWNGTNYGLINYESHTHDRNIDWHEWAHTTVGVRYRSGINFTPTGTGAASSFTSTAGAIMDEDINFTIVASSAFPTANAIRSFYQTGATTYGFDTTTTTQPYKQGTGGRPGYIDSVTYAYTTLPSAANRYVNFFIYGTTDTHTPLYSVAETAVAGTILNGYTSTANARAIPFPNLSGYGLSAELKPLYRMVVRADGVVQAITAADDYRLVSSLPQAAGTTSTTASAVTYTPSGDTSATTVQTALDEIANGKYEFICSSQTAISTSPFTFAGTEARNAGYLVDTTSGNITVNIDADLFTTGYSASICKGSSDANTVIIDAQAGNTINGSQTYTLTRQFEVITLLKDGANAWKIKSNFLPNTIISDTAYDATSWNGDLNAPTKNAVRDKIESMSAGGGRLFDRVSISGQLYTGTIAYQVANTSGTIAGVKASILSLPTGANITIQVYKNGTASTNSIFTSDTPLSLLTSGTLTNGAYTVTDTAIDNGTFAADDVLYVVVTAVGSTLPGSDLSIVIY